MEYYLCEPCSEAFTQGTEECQENIVDKVIDNGTRNPFRYAVLDLMPPTSSARH